MRDFFFLKRATNQRVLLSSLLAVPLMSRMTREELFSARLNIPLKLSQVRGRVEMYENYHIGKIYISKINVVQSAGFRLVAGL